METTTVATRITPDLRQRMQTVMLKHGYINEADFIREAIRTHVFALEQQAE